MAFFNSKTPITPIVGETVPIVSFGHCYNAKVIEVQRLLPPSILRQIEQ